MRSFGALTDTDIDIDIELQLCFVHATHAPDELAVLARSDSPDVRAELARRPRLPAVLRDALALDADLRVPTALASAPDLSWEHQVTLLARGAHEVAAALAENPANRRELRDHINKTLGHRPPPPPPPIFEPTALLGTPTWPRWAVPVLRRHSTKAAVVMVLALHVLLERGQRSREPFHLAAVFAPSWSGTAPSLADAATVLAQLHTMPRGPVRQLGETGGA